MSALNQTFSALGNPTRRAILARLSLGETTLSDIAAPLEMSQTGVTRHVTVLADAGLITVTKRGRTRFCRLEAAPMRAATEWLITYQAFWQDQMGHLASHLGES